MRCIKQEMLHIHVTYYIIYAYSISISRNSPFQNLLQFEMFSRHSSDVISRLLVNFQWFFQSFVIGRWHTRRNCGCIGPPILYYVLMGFGIENS